MDNAKVGLGSALIIGLLVLKWLWDRKKAHPPKYWRKVGHISDIYMFPVKSLGPLKVNEAECSKVGLKSGWLRDRNLLVIDETGRFVTARKYPKMIKIMPSVTGSILSLTAPGMTKVSVDLAKVNKKLRVVVWNDTVPANDCGEEIASWLSRFLLDSDSGFRLVHYPLDKSSRSISNVNKSFQFFERSDLGVFTDETSYAMMNKASIADLNTRLEEPVDPLQFRMNFILEGAEAFDEDNWDWMMIGTVLFRNVRPCARCIFTTINPETAEKHPDREPLETLKKIRPPKDPATKALLGTSPLLGIHLGLKAPNGIVRVGDPVYVGMD